jgi:hypothetical protein
MLKITFSRSASAVKRWRLPHVSRVLSTIYISLYALRKSVDFTLKFLKASVNRALLLCRDLMAVYGTDPHITETSHSSKRIQQVDQAKVISIADGTTVTLQPLCPVDYAVGL